MTLTPEQQKQFAEAAKPLMEWLSSNCHPHTQAHVTLASAELMEGVATFHTEQFIRD